MKKPWRVIDLQGTQGASTAVDREAGIQSVLKPLKGKGEAKIVLNQSADFATDKAQTTMSEALAKSTNVQAVLASNDAMALGAIKALQTQGVTPGKRAIVCGADAQPESLAAIKAGTQYNTVTHPPYVEAFWAVEAMSAYLKDKTKPDTGKFPNGVVKVPQVVVTKANAAQVGDWVRRRPCRPCRTVPRSPTRRGEPLSGYHQPDSGSFRDHGRPVLITSPAQTRRALGIEMVYQDLAMAPDLTVWQNLFLGEESRRLGVLRRAEMRRRARDVLARMKTKIQPDWLVGDLSGGERQLVAVARGLLFDRDIVLLDEPTASVSAAKSEDVLDTIRDLHRRGRTVILSSHRLEDVLAVATRIAVFVTGRLGHLVDNDGIEVADLVHLMFGTTTAPESEA